MADLLGGLTLPLLGASVFVAVLTCFTYRVLSDYLHKWFQMKPIPELEGTYPLIGNALQFKPNAGGEWPLRNKENRQLPNASML